MSHVQDCECKQSAAEAYYKTNLAKGVVCAKPVVASTYLLCVVEKQLIVWRFVEIWCNGVWEDGGRCRC
jgi:hypothetical protein